MGFDGSLGPLFFSSDLRSFGFRDWTGEELGRGYFDIPDSSHKSTTTAASQHSSDNFDLLSGLQPRMSDISNSP